MAPGQIGKGLLGVMLAWLQAEMVTAATTGKRDDSGGTKVLEAHSPFHGRVIFAVVSLVVMCAISGMLALRIRVILPLTTRCIGPVRVITFTSYIIAILFLWSAGLFLSLWDLSTHKRCYVSIELCLAFYTLSKILLYVFLLERAIMMRNKYRFTDPIYLSGLFIILLGWGAIAIIAYLGPVASLSNGICRIGLPNAALGAVLGYDIFINVLLTALYCYITNQLTKNLTWKSVWNVIRVALGFGNYGPLATQASMLQLMMAKSVLAAIATVAVTAVNIAVLFKVKGHEQGWLCLTICCLDVSWGVVIIHWLTSNPLCDYGDRNHCLHSRAESSAEAPPTPTNPAQPRVCSKEAQRVCLSY